MALQTRSSLRLATLRRHDNNSSSSDMCLSDEVFGAVGELPPANVAVPVTVDLAIDERNDLDNYGDASSKSLQLLGSCSADISEAEGESAADAIPPSSGSSAGPQQLEPGQMEPGQLEPHQLEPGQLLVPDSVDHVRFLLNKNLNCRGAVKAFVVKRVNELVLQLNSSSCHCCGEDLQSAHQKGRYVCHQDGCGKRFLLKSSLQRHTRVMHERGDAEKCDKCEFRCGDRGALARHMFTHTGIRPFSCQKCDKHFSRRFHLERHQKSPACSLQSGDTICCKVCGKKFSRLDNLREHMKTHIDNHETSRQRRTFDCTQCGKQLASSSILQIHMRSHTGERPFPCDLCDKRFQSWRTCVKHRRTHTGERPFACDQCDRRFSAKETLNRHLKTHGTSLPHECERCGKRFLQASQLKSHLFHHTGVGGFTCQLCGKSFSRKARLRSHVEFVHEGRKSFSCDQCSRQFVRRSDLSRHALTHAAVKQHRCAICDKAFALKAALKAHLLTHTKEAPRSCVGCGRAFIRQDCLVRHMRRKHQDVLEDVMAKSDECKVHRQMEPSDEKSAPSPGVTDTARLSESSLSSSLYELLTLLIDADTLSQLTNEGGAVGVEELTSAVIERCGHSSHTEPTLSAADRLREKAKRLFTVVIDDPAVQTLLTTHSIDQVIMHVLKLART